MAVNEFATNCLDIELRNKKYRTISGRGISCLAGDLCLKN